MLRLGLARFSSACMAAVIVGCRPTQLQPVATVKTSASTPNRDSAVYTAILRNSKTSDLSRPFLVVDTARSSHLGLHELEDDFAKNNQGFGQEPNSFDAPKHPAAPAYGASLTPADWRELTSSFQTRSGKQYPIEHFELPKPLKWISEADLDAIGGRDYWSKFHKRFPGISGTEEFSTVGYSRDGTLAVVCVSIGAGMKSASKSLVLLERKGSDWRVVQTFLAMIA